MLDFSIVFVFVSLCNSRGHPGTLSEICLPYLLSAGTKGLSPPLPAAACPVANDDAREASASPKIHFLFCFVLFFQPGFSV